MENVNRIEGVGQCDEMFARSKCIVSKTVDFIESN